MIRLDGKETSNTIKEEIKVQVTEMKAKGERVPHLAAVLVGTDGASLTYVGSYTPQTAGDMTFTMTNDVPGATDYVRWDAAAYRITTAPDTTPPVITEFTATANGSTQIDLTLGATD